MTVESSTNLIDLDVDNHDYLHTEWTSGIYDSECSYGLYDPNGVLVAEAGTLSQPSLTMTHTIDFSGTNIFSNSGFEGATTDNPEDLQNGIFIQTIIGHWKLQEMESIIPLKHLSLMTEKSLKNVGCRRK